MGSYATDPCSSGKPAILVLHGAWHTPRHYEKLTNMITSAGYTAICPLLPTGNDAIPPNRSLDDDVSFARKTAQELLSKGQDLVVLMHSYGGAVGSYALTGLHKVTVTDTKAGRLRAIIYMCSFIPMAGESLAGIFGGQLPPWATSNPETKLVDVDDPQGHFYNDLSPEEAESWTNQLVAHGTVGAYRECQNEEVLKQTKGKMTWEYGTKEPSGLQVHYLFCEKDAALPLFVQEMMADRIEGQGRLGPGVVGRWYCDGSHSPFLSMPAKVVEVIENIVSSLG